METQSKPVTPREFEVGTPVIYGLLGKCSIAAIETREISGEVIRCYRLEVQKSALSRSTRQGPAIWIPISAAQARGLRAPIATQAEVDAIFEVLGSREYYFNLNEAWSSVYPKLEASIRSEGSIGLAKAYSYLHVLKRKQVVPSTEVTKFHENVGKLLFRELSEFRAESIRALEERAARLLKQKQALDH